MSGLTWLHMGEKEFDCQVIRAALVRDIRGLTAIGPGGLFMVPGSPDMDRAVFENFSPRSRSFLDLRKRYTEKSEG